MRVSLITICLIFSIASAAASTRSYFAPKSDGQPIGACLADGESCGKQAADVFCRKEGFKESILFSRETVSKARILDSDKSCEGATCEAFKRIKCYLPVAQGAASVE
jgi:hypothetical protein